MIGGLISIAVILGTYDPSIELWISSLLNYPLLTL